MASRTQCLLISSNNATAFISPTSKSASSSTRKRTRISSPSTSDRKMTLFTLIYISLAVITLFLSPSAYAEGKYFFTLLNYHLIHHIYMIYFMDFLLRGSSGTDMLFAIPFHSTITFHSPGSS